MRRSLAPPDGPQVGRLVERGSDEEADEPPLPPLGPLMHARGHQPRHTNRDPGLLEGLACGRLLQALAGLDMAAGQLPPDTARRWWRSISQSLPSRVTVNAVTRVRHPVINES
jgi:hypothetical protein